MVLYLQEVIPTVHVPDKTALIKQALDNTDFRVKAKCSANTYFYDYDLFCIEWPRVALLRNQEGEENDSENSYPKLSYV